MRRDAGGFARTRLLQLALALGMLCALAFLLGQGVASLHATIVATSSAAQAGHGPRALNAPLVNERVTGAIGTPANVASASSGPTAFSGGAQQAVITTSAQPHADHAPPKHQRRQRGHTPHNKAAGDASHGGLVHPTHRAHAAGAQPLAQQPAPRAHGQQRHDR